jgi:hypothetical protein
MISKEQYEKLELCMDALTEPVYLYIWLSQLARVLPNPAALAVLVPCFVRFSLP